MRNAVIILVLALSFQLQAQKNIYLQIDGTDGYKLAQKEKVINMKPHEQFRLFLKYDSNYFPIDSIEVNSVTIEVKTDFSPNTRTKVPMNKMHQIGNGIVVSEIYQDRIRRIDITVPKQVKCGDELVSVGNKHKRSFSILIN